MGWPTACRSHNRFWMWFSTHCLWHFGWDGMCGRDQFSNRSEPSEACPTNLRWVGAGNSLFWWLYLTRRSWHKAEPSHLSFWWKEWMLHVRITKVKWSWCLGAHWGILEEFSILRSRVGILEVEEVLYYPQGWSWDHMVSGGPGCWLWLCWRHWQSRDSLWGPSASPPGRRFLEWMWCGWIILVRPGQA